MIDNINRTPDRLKFATPAASVVRNLSTAKGSGNKYLDDYLKMRGKLLDKFPQRLSNRSH